MRNKFFIVFFSFVFLIPLNISLFSQSHPFMVLKESDYNRLREKSEKWPWSVMKSKALDFADNNIEYVSSISYIRKCYGLYDIVNSLILSYILDPVNKQNYVHKFEDVVLKYLDDIREEKESDKTPDDHRYNVGPSHAAFMIYIGLDIMHKDLDANKRKLMEDDCDYIASHHTNLWQESKYSIEAMKELYHTGASQTFIDKKNKYISYLKSNSTNDGIYATGPGYAYSRLFMRSRVQKKMFIDVVEYHGFKDFYNDPVFVNLHEWLFGYGVTPFNKSYTFGDTPPVKSFDEWAPSVMRLNRFSEKAVGYAYWHLDEYGDKYIEPELFTYLFYNEPQQKIKPVSRIFPNGGAWLLDDKYSKVSLAGVLWNMYTDNQSHGHYDVNSINIVGYGDFIIRNVGYDGWEEPDEKTWKWISRNAESSNTVLINDENHVDFRGDGITESIISEAIEYSSGSSGSAIASGVHNRNLLFIKPQDNLAGYFILFDEIKSESNNSNFNLVLHPNSIEEPEKINEDFEYDWDIKTCSSENDIKVKICLATKPASVEIREGYRASYNDCSRYTGKYLYSTYTADKNGEANLASVIYPYLANDVLPEFKRINSDNVEGVVLKYNNTNTDILLASKSKNNIETNGFSFKANSIFCRIENGKPKNIFVRNSQKFIHKNSAIGFESDKAISIVLSGTTGEVVSPGTNLKIYYQGIKRVVKDGNIIDNIESGDNWIEIYIEKGNHKIKIVTE